MSVKNGTRLQTAPLITLVLLAGIWAERTLLHGPPDDAAAYHARVRAVAADLPYRIGEWVGSDVETPPAAIAMLKPNVLRCRRFVHQSTGEHATMMIVQCQDARDMSGHYPPICYPAHGWTLRESTRKDLVVAGIPVPTRIYRFTIESIDRFDEILVYNFFVRRDGPIESERRGVLAVSERRMRVFGAGQVQVVFSPSMHADRRDEVFQMLVSQASTVIDAIRVGSDR